MVRGFPLKMRARAGGAYQSVHKHEYAWIKGTVSTLVLQDFVGAAFGAMFFTVTAEVWNLAAALKPLNVFAIFVISLILGFALIYLSKRRRETSEKLEHTASMRAVEIYVVSFFTALLFVLVFQTATSMELIFKQTVMIALPSVVSAATADLLFF